MLKLLIIAFGGAVGSVARYLASGLTYRFAGAVFPWGTLMVNLTGSFIIGFLWELFDRTAASPNARLLVFVGFLGGYTTFSSYSLEVFNLIREGEHRMALYNVLASNLAGIAMVFAGSTVSRQLIPLLR